LGFHKTLTELCNLSCEASHNFASGFKSLSAFLLKSIHIILAFSVLISSTGITLQAHVCMKKWQAAATGQQAAFAQEKQKNRLCCSKSQTSAACPKGSCSKSCCHKRSQFFQSDEHLSVFNFGFKNLTTEKAALLPAVFKVLLPVFSLKTQHFEQYKPPLLFRDLSTLFQSFLC
jgi:hypothetical protein